MIALVQFHLPTLIVALLIGIVTAWWAFPRSDGPTHSHINEDKTD